MSFLEAVGELLLVGFEKLKEKVDETQDKYYDSYEESSRRYENMSDERLERELERLRNDTSGDSIKRVAKMKAMKEELDKRRG